MSTDATPGAEPAAAAAAAPVNDAGVAPPPVPTAAAAAAAAPAPGAAATDATPPAGGAGGTSSKGGMTRAQKRAAKKRAKRAAKKAGATAAAAAAAPAKAEGTPAPAAGSTKASGAGGLKMSGKLDAEKLYKMRRAMAMEARKEEETKPKSHKFWDAQPVPKLGAKVTEHGPLDSEKTVDDIRAEPLPLLKGFEWSTVDITDAEQRKEVYNLLTKNYVEDDDNMFRFDYSEQFLLWALTVPGYHQDWHVGVRQSSNGRLRGFISGIPEMTHIYDKRMVTCEINFLCVHKKLRSMRLAPVLIKEVTRRVNRRGIFQAVYTAGVVIPKPVGACQYWHRSLNVKKLIEINFTRLQPRMTMNRTQRLYKLPPKPKTPGFRPMEVKDGAAVTKLLHTYLAKFDLWVEWDTQEVLHWLLPREGVVNSYVVENPETHEVTDVCSFYHLPSTIIGNPKHKILRAAYSFYNVATSIPFLDLMNDMLIAAKAADFDVFNALDLMENSTVLKKLKFGPGDGTLNYYLYNWGCPEMASERVGLVLL